LSAIGSRKSSRVSLAVLTTLATLIALVIPLTGNALATHAPASTVNADPESASNPAGTDHTITATADNDDAHIKFAVISGPNQDFDNDGLNNADDSCTDTGTNEWECTYTSNGDAGTDTIRVFADNDDDDLIDGNEPRDDVTKTWFGDPFSVTMEPASDSGAVGTCNEFTVTATDENGNPVEGATIDISQTHEDDTAATDFCQAEDGPLPADETGTGTETSHAEFGPTDENGQVVIGIESDTEGTVTVRAWWESADNDTFNTGEPTDTSTKTWTAGGADAVATLDCEPETSSNPTNSDHTITCTAENASGDPVPDVDVLYRVDSGPNANVEVDDTSDTNDDVNSTGQDVWCTTSNDGSCSDFYTSSAAGTDNFTFWIQQSCGGTGGPDACEPQDQVAKTWTAAPTNVDIDVTCEGDPEANFSDEDCVNPVTDNDEVFTAEVTDSSTGDPRSGIRVDWELSDNTEGSTLSANQCTTDAEGECSVTVTNPSPEDGDDVDVTGTVAGTGESDTGSKTWQEPTVSNLDLTPDNDTNQTGDFHTVTATVTDQFGDPVQGVNVDFEVNAFGGGGGSLNAQTDNNHVTNASGQTQFGYQDQGPLNAEHDDDICATADLDGDDGGCIGNLFSGEPADVVNKNWIPEPAVAATVVLDMDTGDGCEETGEETTATNEVDDTHEICAHVETSGGQELQGHDVTFSSSGVGHFADDFGDHDDLGTSVTVQSDSNGDAFVILHSEDSGTQNVTATSDSASDSGTKTWTAADARNISLTPETATNEPGTNHELTALVTDRFGNPRPGITVTWQRTGAGSFVSTETTTNANGEARAVITSAAEGTTQVTSSITPGADVDCDDAGSTDPNDPAGNCSDSASKTWAVTPPVACNDGVDNDGDGKVDFPADPGCSSETDTTETGTFRRASSVSIRHTFSPHVFKGRVNSGPRRCERGRLVTIKEVRRGPDAVEGRDRTNRRGRYVEPHNRFGRGRYYAVAGRKTFTNRFGDTIICRRARSDTIRVRR